MQQRRRQGRSRGSSSSSSSSRRQRSRGRLMWHPKQLRVVVAAEALQPGVWPEASGGKGWQPTGTRRHAVITQTRTPPMDGAACMCLCTHSATGPHLLAQLGCVPAPLSGCVRAPGGAPLQPGPRAPAHLWSPCSQCPPPGWSGGPQQSWPAPPSAPGTALGSWLTRTVLARTCRRQRGVAVRA